MSIASPDVLNDRHDSQKFKETHRADPAMPFETEGGWVLTRPRYTRPTPILYSLGFTDISDTDKQIIQQLYSDTHGGSLIISDWEHPTSGVLVNVRFKQGSIPQYTYRGRGGNHRWDVSGVQLEEV